MEKIDTELLDDANARVRFACVICADLLHEPTSVCVQGHPFCSDCIAKHLTRKSECPTCRRPATPATRLLPFEEIMLEATMRCKHAARRDDDAEPPTKRAKGLEPCPWRGIVGEYRAHLAGECLLEPVVCPVCSETVAHRCLLGQHEPVCLHLCPHFGCGHRATRADMATHLVEHAATHALTAARKIAELESKTSELEGKLDDLRDWTRVKFAWRPRAKDIFTAHEQDSAFFSPSFLVWPGFRLQISATDVRETRGDPEGTAFQFCINNKLDKIPSRWHGRLFMLPAVSGPSQKCYTYGCRDHPHRFPSQEEKYWGTYHEDRFTGEQIRSVTHEDGKLYIMAEFWFKDEFSEVFSATNSIDVHQDMAMVDLLGITPGVPSLP